MSNKEALHQELVILSASLLGIAISITIRLLATLPVCSVGYSETYLLQRLLDSRVYYRSMLMFLQEIHYSGHFMHWCNLSSG